ncbi:MAG: RICIN domain-containing protein, partial [Lachnospiraceae bacterium]|nr:RICIN domain-containing protein [Candidatus Equihabitans merdae]
MKIHNKRYLLMLSMALFLMLSGVCMGRTLVLADTTGGGISSITTYYDGRWFRVRGILPEGLSLQVEAYSLSEGLELVRENIDGLAQAEDILFAYDLTLVDEEGNVYEPDETMDVSISDCNGDDESGLLYHVSDNLEEVDYRMTGGLINFQTDGFSPYILLEENKVQDAAPGTGPYVISLPRSQSSKPRLYVSAASSNPSILEDSGYDKVVMREGTGASGEAYTYRDIWLIQEVPGTRYYFIRNIFNQGNMGSAQMGALGLWYPNAGSDTHQFQITRNSDGTYTFHLVGLSKYGTDCVLDVAGGEESAATGTRVLSYGANGGNNQRFELHKAQTHNISCNLTEGHLSVNHHTGNEFAVWDLNSPSLPQNTADHINGMENVFTPSDSGIHVSVIQPTDTYPFGNAKRAQIISEATDGTYLPIFKVSMDKWNGDWSNPSRYIEVIYPEAGTMRVNGRTIKAGAVLRFYNIRPSDPASGRTFLLAKDAKDINDDPDATNLYIATNLYRGYW